MTMDVVPVEGDEDEEDLEAGASYKAREGGRDAFDVEMVEQVEEDTKMEEEEDEVDELEAFMSGVTKQVKTVDASDKARLLSVGNGKKVNLGEPEVDYADEVESEDEVDKVGNSAEAILAYVPLSPPTKLTCAGSRPKRSSVGRSSRRSTTPRSTTSRSGASSTIRHQRSSC